MDGKQTKFMAEQLTQQMSVGVGVGGIGIGVVNIVVFVFVVAAVVAVKTGELTFGQLALANKAHCQVEIQ